MRRFFVHQRYSIPAKTGFTQDVGNFHFSLSHQASEMATSHGLTLRCTQLGLIISQDSEKIKD
ncbi:hypothetical protein XBFFL1_1920018 [Xenorhabdus bovienii str. feltiae Florida]|nr:hypothetical protein XBFFR1_1290008 [Xenorhabdus bovienii str. feltiae France]CDG92026.1 hypothetical protein XBFFL1_1920018 [Xenorhabdus bovienii str. feltiae Florida]